MGMDGIGERALPLPDLLGGDGGKEPVLYACVTSICTPCVQMYRELAAVAHACAEAFPALVACCTCADGLRISRDQCTAMLAGGCLSESATAVHTAVQ